MPNISRTFSIQIDITVPKMFFGFDYEYMINGYWISYLNEH